MTASSTQLEIVAFRQALEDAYSPFQLVTAADAARASALLKTVALKKALTAAALSQLLEALEKTAA
jgi:hypothetical protein